MLGAWPMATGTLATVCTEAALKETALTEKLRKATGL